MGPYLDQDRRERIREQAFAIRRNFIQRELQLVQLSADLRLKGIRRCRELSRRYFPSGLAEVDG